MVQLCTFLNILFSKYRTRIISTRGYYSFLRVLQAILFSKIKEVTKGAGTIQERVLITPVQYLDLGVQPFEIKNFDLDQHVQLRLL